MANTYRMVHVEPLKINIEMQTVAGWIVVDTAATVGAAKNIIIARKEKENWIVKYYDEAGDLVADDGSTSNQPVVNA